MNTKGKANSALKMCVTACNRHLLQSHHQHHHIIYTALTELLMQQSSIHALYLVSSCMMWKVATVRCHCCCCRRCCKLHYWKWNNTWNGENTQAHSAHKLKFSAMNKIRCSTSHIFPLQSTCEIARLDTIRIGSVSSQKNHSLPFRKPRIQFRIRSNVVKCIICIPISSAVGIILFNSIWLWN